MGATRISHLANDLVNRGLLSRRRLRHDRRVVMPGLTPAGRELTARATEALQHYYAKLAAGVTPEEFQVFAVTALRITASFEET